MLVIDSFASIFLLILFVIFVLIIVYLKYRSTIRKYEELYERIRSSSPWIYDILIITDLKSCIILSDVSILRDSLSGTINGKRIILSIPTLKYPLQSYILDLSYPNDEKKKIGFLLGTIRNDIIFPVVKRKHVNYLLLVPEFITMLSKYLSYDIRSITQEAKEVLKTAGQIKKLFREDKRQLAFYLGGHSAMDREILKAFAEGYFLVSNRVMSIQAFEEMILTEGMESIRSKIKEIEEEKKKQGEEE